MKFTKQQAFEKLKAELTKDGKTPHLSDRSINDYVDNLLEIEGQNEELELDAFVTKYRKTLLSMDGNVNHDVSSGVTDFKTQWEKDHPTQTPPTPPTPPAPSDDMKAVLDRLKALEDENTRIKSEKTISQKKTDLLAKMKEKGIDNDEWSKGMLAQISITSELDVDAKATELLDFYNKTQAHIPPQPVTPGAPGGQVDTRDNAIAQASARMKAKAEAERASFQ